MKRIHNVKRKFIRRLLIKSVRFSIDWREVKARKLHEKYEMRRRKKKTREKINDSILHRRSRE